MSRQDALVEPPKRGQKAQAAAPTLRHAAVANQARTAFGNGENQQPQQFHPESNRMQSTEFANENLKKHHKKDNFIQSNRK